MEKKKQIWITEEHKNKLKILSSTKKKSIKDFLESLIDYNFDIMKEQEFKEYSDTLRNTKEDIKNNKK